MINAGKPPVPTIVLDDDGFKAIIACTVAVIIFVFSIILAFYALIHLAIKRGSFLGLVYDDFTHVKTGLAEFVKDPRYYGFNKKIVDKPNSTKYTNVLKPSNNKKHTQTRFFELPI